jgi:hypothetical protein
MNYAVVVLGFVLVFCVAYYWVPGFGGRTFLTGPVRTIDSAEVAEVAEAKSMDDLGWE